jgi:hypothetical protein
MHSLGRAPHAPGALPMPDGQTNSPDLGLTNEERGAWSVCRTARGCRCPAGFPGHRALALGICIPSIG